MGICCMTQGTQTGALYQPRGGGGERWEGGDICIPMGDSYLYLSETKEFCCLT